MFFFFIMFLLTQNAFSFFRHSLRKSNHIFMKKNTSDFSFLHEDFSTSSKKSRKSLIPEYKARTDNQKLYVKALKNYDFPVVFGTGPAGSGKTLFACLAAMQQLKLGNINKIILTRPVVPVEEEELGFLPGNLIRKMDPWTRPIFDIFLEFYQQREIEAMLHSGTIEVSPLAYMRGRTFKRAFLIADEMQNSTPNQMLMLTTRIGDHSKMVITGDLKQSDKLDNNGLADFTNKFKSYSSQITGIQMVQLNEQDIQRSPIVNEILHIYNLPPTDVNTLHSDTSQFYYDNTSDAAIIPKSHEPNRDLI
jgi:phosphate starvation-inducible protein PhoH and related proteins